MIRQAIAVPLLLRVRASLLEVENLFPSRKALRHDLRFRVINHASDQMIFAISNRNDVVISRISKNLQHFTGNTQLCPCKIRVRGLTTIPGIKGILSSPRLRNAKAWYALNALTKSKSSHSFRGFSKHGAISRAAFHFRRHAGL